MSPVLTTDDMDLWRQELGAVSLVFAQCVMAALFSLSCATKLRPRARAAFVASIRVLRLMPRSLAPAAAAGVIAAELAIPVLVLIPATRRAGFALALAALVGFALVAVRAQLRGIRAPCNCFGSGRTLGAVHAVRNGVLAAIAIAGWLLSGEGARAAGPPAVYAVAIAGALLCVTLVVKLDDIRDLFARPQR